MEGTGFLKTVNFGGFDKKDVLAYVDDLNTKIYTLEQELEEKRNQLANGGGAASSAEANEEMQKQHTADLSKISELKAANDSLKMQVKSLEDEVAGKNKEITALKDKCTDLEDKLATASTDSSSQDTTAFDISGVFMEAKKSADKIVLEARNMAKKTEADANELADKVVSDANIQAASIIRTADSSAKKSVADAEVKARSLLTEAETKSTEILSSSESIRTSVTNELNEIESNVAKLNEVLELFSKESLSKLTETKQVISQAQTCLKNGQPFKGNKSNFKSPEPVKSSEPTREPIKAAAPAPAPAPASKPAAPVAPTPAPVNNARPAQPAQQQNSSPANNQAPKKKKFSFDMSEMDEITRAIEAAEASNGQGGAKVDDYDGNINPNKIKLSDMN